MKKNQKTLDGFFINKNPVKINDIDKSDQSDQSEKYYYLQWNNKFKPNGNAYWTNKKPDKINFIAPMQNDYICGYFEDIDEKTYNLPSEKVYKNISYLKSHLQKCIRKKDDIRAIPTCYHLLKLDANELLRRLPIIMLEDTILHESFTTLIWLMVALSTKKFKLKTYMYEWILGVIYVLCIIDEKDYINSVNDNNNIKSDLARSINLRISYGGTENDINMLEDRLRHNSKKVNTVIIRPISLMSIKELNIDDWDFSAIDYHCNSKFLEYISKKYDEIEVDELKKIIWNHSSGVNVRDKSPTYNIKGWNEIKDYVLKTQKYLLSSGY